MIIRVDLWGSHRNKILLTLAAHAQAGYGSQSVRMCTPFSNARGNSKVRMRCQYIGNEVINQKYVGDCAQTFCSKVMASHFRLTSERWTAPRPLTPPIVKHRPAIACKVMIVKLESCRVRVNWVCATLWLHSIAQMHDNTNVISLIMYHPHQLSLGARRS